MTAFQLLTLILLFFYKYRFGFYFSASVHCAAMLWIVKYRYNKHASILIVEAVYDWGHVCWESVISSSYLQAICIFLTWYKWGNPNFMKWRGFYILHLVINVFLWLDYIYNLQQTMQWLMGWDDVRSETILSSTSYTSVKVCTVIREIMIFSRRANKIDI